MKDHMREAGDVLFTDVDSSCRGIVEFEKADAMNYAIRNLDGSRFTSHEVCTGLPISQGTACHDQNDYLKSESLVNQVTT